VPSSTESKKVYVFAASRTTVQKELMRHASISDHSEYVWRRDDGLNAGSEWAGGEAGDAALMDVSGRLRIA